MQREPIVSRNQTATTSLRAGANILAHNPEQAGVPGWRTETVFPARERRGSAPWPPSY